MNFFSRYKKELILGALMLLLGGGIFFAGASVTGETIRMPSLPSAREQIEDAGEEAPEESAGTGGTAAAQGQAEETETEEAVPEETAGETEKAPEEEEPRAEDSAEVKAEEEEARRGQESEEKTEKKKKKKKKKEKTQIAQEPYDQEAQARKEKGEFIGQIDAIIAAEDFWGKYPRQIPEGYTEKSGYTYDTWISHNATAKEPWYEITLCITDHKQDTRIDRRARVDAYSGKVTEDQKA